MLAAALGAGDRYLGRLHHILGHTDQAIALHQAALTLGAPALQTLTRVEFAEMLLTRRQPGDERTARTLLEEAGATAGRLAMTAIPQPQRPTPRRDGALPRPRPGGLRPVRQAR